MEASRTAHRPDTNCKPVSAALDAETGEIMGEAVTLFAPLPKDEYRAVRERFLTDQKSIKKLGATLPDNLLAALSLDTADLRKQGWSQPSAARKVRYLRPMDALRPARRVHKAVAARVTTTQFLLVAGAAPAPRRRNFAVLNSRDAAARQ